MNLFLVKGYLDVAATTLADAQALLAAMADPTTSANGATIERVMDKLESLVQADSGEPLVISSIDDTAGTISAWVTDAGVTLAAAVGFPDPSTTMSYVTAGAFSIVGNTRSAVLDLSGATLTEALRITAGRRSSVRMTLHVRKTEDDVTETVALLSVSVAVRVA